MTPYQEWQALGQASIDLLRAYESLIRTGMVSAAKDVADIRERVNAQHQEAEAGLRNQRRN